MEIWRDLNQPILALVYYSIMLMLVVPLVRRYRSVHPLVSFYIGSYVICQYLSPKYTYFLGLTVPGGNIAFVATVALMDAIVISAGLSVARQVIFSGFLLQVLLTVSNLSTIKTPSPEWVSEEAVNAFLAISARVAVASPVAYLAAELFNAYVTHRYRRVWWARTLYSDPFALIIDTLVFTPIAFYGALPSDVLLDIIVGLSSVKLAFVPLNLLAVYIFRRAVEGALRPLEGRSLEGNK
ncbi:MAG: queuosine precursor transporter [Fervidicoccaceae archaeon]